MATKKQLFEQMLSEGKNNGRVLFRPILMHFAARFIGKTYGQFASNYKVLAEANLRCMEHFDLDMIGLISDPYRETSAFGAPVKFIDEGVPRCLEIIVKSEDDIKALKRPDVYKSARTLDRIKGGELLYKETKGEVPIIGWIEGPLAEAADLAGVQEMLMQLMMNPDFANLLMDKCMDTAKDFAEAQINAGCDVIGMGDAVCSQIDEFTYDAFVKERHKEIIQFIHDKGAKVKLHICGNITHLLPYIAELNCDLIDIDWQVDLDQARNILGPNVVLTGNIDPVVIQNKSRDQVFEISRTLCEKYKDQRYILSAGCEITVNTPHENLMAMREASKY